MSSMLNSIPGKKRFQIGRKNQGQQRNQRPANLLSAPVVLDIDDTVTLSSFQISDGDSRQHPTILDRKIAPRHAIIPVGKSFSVLQGFLRRAYRKLGLKHGLSVALIIFYTILGAGMFLIMEKRTDIDRLKLDYKHYTEEKRQFIRWFLSNGTNLVKSVTGAKARRIFEKRLQEYEDSIGFSIQKETEWNFWNAMYFAGTIYTTIGYGDLYCRTTTGRLFTMVYSIIGIPLVLSALTDLGMLQLKFLINLAILYNQFASYIIPKNPCGIKPPIADLSKKRGSKESPGPDDISERNESELKSEIADEIDDLEELDRREEEEYEDQIMRVPVLIALLATVGWIFLCAGLYCLWEDWSYFTSIYFFFISLSTIGLGDETPKRKDLMVATYAFVIIGLSLVSMCITVIQRRLEDLYLQILRMILQEYHKRLSEGDDQLGATMGIMNFWDKNKSAKYLVPLLSKHKKQNVAHKFHHEAKEKGIAVPAVLRDLDPKTGLPAVFKVAKRKVIEGQAQIREAVADAIRRAAEKARALNEPDEDAALETMYSVQAEQLPIPLSPLVPAPPDPSRPPVPSQAIFYNAAVQTDEVARMKDKQQQTVSSVFFDGQVQTEDSSFVESEYVDEACQATVRFADSWTQWGKDGDNIQYQSTLDTVDDVAQTDVVPNVENAVQTENVVRRDHLIQTDVLEMAEEEVQTEQVHMNSQSEQTPKLDTVENETQTDSQSVETPQQVPGPSNHGWSKAKTNLHDILRKAVAGMGHSSKPKLSQSQSSPRRSSAFSASAGAALASWDDIKGENTSEEGDSVERRDEVMEEMEEGKERRPGASKRVRGNLKWNPVDGLHAEKQRRVSDLKDLFEKKDMFKKAWPKQQASSEDDEE